MDTSRGFVISTDYKTFSARANVEINASKKLKFGINIAPTYSISNDPGVEGKDADFSPGFKFGAGSGRHGGHLS
jgi:hypothetical protein